MSKESVWPSRSRGLLLVMISMLIASLLPLPSIEAALIQRPLDNTIPEFARGTFQRSSLSLLQKNVSSAKLEDKEGAVQLGPIGLLKEWRDSSFRLPKRLSKMGATSIGNRIYLMGGVTPLDQASSENVDEVWSVGVSLENGTLLSDWEAEPDLPAVQSAYRTGFNGPVGPVNSPAVTSIDNASGNDYIYVIGGNISFGTFDISSYGVRIATVGSNGRITGWQEGPAIPSPLDGCTDAPANNCFSQLGLQNASAATVSVGGVNYVYIIGGLQRFTQGSGSQTQIASEGSNKVFYARVGANGKLFKPSSPSTEGWDLITDANGTVPTDLDVGIWDGLSVIDRFVVSGIGLYYMGGQTGNQVSDSTPAVRSSTVYRATVQGDGKLTWANDTYTLPEARIGHAGVTVNGNVYVTGGQPSTSDQPDKSVLTTYIEDDFSLPSIGEGDSNFLKNDALPAPRTRHASVLVRATSTNPNVPEAGFVYVLGGQGDTNDGLPDDDQGSDSVIYSRINGDEDLENGGYAPTGWFYSDPLDIEFQQAEVQEVNWATEINRQAGMDIRIEYRVSTANSCDNPGWSDADWQVLDGSPGDGFNSIDGQNTVDNLTVDARCFQYRARLSTNSDNLDLTPSLLNVSIQIFIPGSPDLHISKLEGQNNSSGQFTGLDITIKNEYSGPDNEPTLAADAEGPGEFFVDMFIFGPGETVQQPQLPIDQFSNNPPSKAYTVVNKSLMGANASLSITNYKWCSTADENYQTCSKVPLSTLFPVAGTYTIIVAVDSYGCTQVGCVNESAAGAEDNNTNQTQVTLPKKDPSCTENCEPDIGNGDLYLPLISR